MAGSGQQGVKMSKGSRARPLGISRAEFDRNWNEIFGKKENNVQAKADSTFGTCTCGRSPIGKCIGWHGLNEQQLAKACADYAQQTAKKSAETK